MGTVVEVRQDNFTAEVIEKSYEKPVLVDFFAQWCGPCQMLKPMLEKLAQEYDFVLAKVDIDESPALANAYSVEGVPDVRIVNQGQVEPGFVGALTEVQLRELLANQLNLQSDLEAGIAGMVAALDAGDPRGALQQLQRLASRYPEERRLMIEGAKLLLRVGNLEDAERLAGAIQASDREFYDQAVAVKELIDLVRLSRETAIASEWDREFFKAIELTMRGDHESSLDLLLDIVRGNRKYRDDGARKAMLMIFSLLGLSHPLSNSYRKQLMLAMY